MPAGHLGHHGAGIHGQRTPGGGSREEGARTGRLPGATGPPVKQQSRFLRSGSNSSGRTPCTRRANSLRRSNGREIPRLVRIRASASPPRPPISSASQLSHIVRGPGPSAGSVHRPAATCRACANVLSRRCVAANAARRETIGGRSGCARRSPSGSATDRPALQQGRFRNSGTKPPPPSASTRQSR